MTLLDFQLVLGRHNIRPPHFASKVSYSASPQASAKCPRGAPCSDAAFAMLFGSKPRRFFLYFEHPNCRRGNALFVLQHFALASQHSQGVERQGLHLVFAWIEIDRGQEADAMSQARRDIFGMRDAARDEDAIDFPT